jgi:hypothetical protein
MKRTRKYSNLAIGWQCRGLRNVQGGGRMNLGISFRAAARLAVAILGLLPLTAVRAHAQFGPPPPPAQPVNPRKIAPQDFTGYWVSVVTEDWRFRMITPDKGDFTSVPLNSEGVRVTNLWDPVKDTASGNQCRSYGAPAIMRVPTRLHITWADDNTLQIQTDAGQQTRLFHFKVTSPGNEAPSWQGYSIAEWDGLPGGGMFRLPTVLAGGAAAAASEGYLKVVTTDLRAGYLRKNGVPYSANTNLLEYYDGFKEPNGDRWLVVTTVVTDPQYLSQPFITSSHFKKEPDASKWDPTPCEAQ